MWLASSPETRRAAPLPATCVKVTPGRCGTALRRLVAGVVGVVLARVVVAGVAAAAAVRRLVPLVVGVVLAGVQVRAGSDPLLQPHEAKATPLLDAGAAGRRVRAGIGASVHWEPPWKWTPNPP